VRVGPPPSDAGGIIGSLAYRDPDEHRRSRLRALEEEAEQRLADLEQAVDSRLRESRARNEFLLAEERRKADRLRRENAMLERRLSSARDEDDAQRTLLRMSFGVWLGAIAALMLWLALRNFGLCLFCLVLSGSCGAAIGYFLDR